MLYIDSKKVLKMIKKLIQTDKIQSLKSNIQTSKTNIINIINKKLEHIKNISDQTEAKLRSQDHEVNLKQSSIWVRAITISLIGGTCFGVTWLALAKTEEIVVVQGKLEPIGGVIDVQIPIQGVAKRILVKEGQIVEKGQMLLELDTEITEAKQKWLTRNYSLNKEILNRIENLAKEGAIAEIKYLEQKNKVAEIENQIIQNNVTLKYQKIISPITGKVFDLKPQEVGYVAQSSEPILKIVPLNKLKAKIEIDSRSIGFVKVGQKADISIDSFPASDFGVVAGEIIRIGSDALAPNPTMNQGYRFPADIQLNEQKLTLRNGQELSLQAGMSLTANIKLRKVSYLQLLLGVFQNKADSLRSI
tara:strand:- start:25 stop:1107 length:1083 start_codon:yes stop_codon:yes gene_type:complete